MESAASALLFLFRGSASEAEGVLVLPLIYFFFYGCSSKSTERIQLSSFLGCVRQHRSHLCLCVSPGSVLIWERTHLRRMGTDQERSSRAGEAFGMVQYYFPLSLKRKIEK